jgi:uncharacterized protein (TIGR00730 family)
MERLCVFCGSSTGANPVYAAGARELGRALAAAKVTAVYGGGGGGLMGAFADAVLAAGGSVIGVIPRSLVARELAHRQLTELRTVDSMHERKAMMADLSDGFVALPGGAGTLEEFCEIWTWAQLGIHQKPCGLLNAGGYYDAFLAFLDQMVAAEFLRPEHRGLVLVENDVQAMLERLEAYRAPDLPRWLGRSGT